MAKKKRNANSPLMWTGIAIYGSLLLLFGWQTWEFVNWLFPDDQLGAKVLTLISFDVLALFWSLVHTFYSFKSHGALWWVRIAWGLTFSLSLVASVLNLTISFYFRFQLAVDYNAVKVGYAVSIIALVANILSLMCWLILEYSARHPRHHEFEQDEDDLPDLPVHQPGHLPDIDTRSAALNAYYAYGKAQNMTDAEIVTGWRAFEAQMMQGPTTSPLPVAPPTRTNGATQPTS